MHKTNKMCIAKLSTKKVLPKGTKSSSKAFWASTTDYYKDER